MLINAWPGGRRNASVLLPLPLTTAGQRACPPVSRRLPLAGTPDPPSGGECVGPRSAVKSWFEASALCFVKLPVEGLEAQAPVCQASLGRPPFRSRLSRRASAGSRPVSLSCAWSSEGKTQHLSTSCKERAWFSQSKGKRRGMKTPMNLQTES